MQENLDPAYLPDDLEILTDEDRFLFRKIGLSMKPFLLLGKNYFYRCALAYNEFLGESQILSDFCSREARGLLWYDREYALALEA